MQPEEKSRQQLMEELDEMKWKLVELDSSGIHQFDSTKGRQEELFKYTQIIERSGEAILVFQDGYVKLAGGPAWMLLEAHRRSGWLREVWLSVSTLLI